MKIVVTGGSGFIGHNFVKKMLDAGHDYRYAVDFSKISERLGWMPETDFDVALEHTVEWYLGIFQESSVK